MDAQNRVQLPVGLREIMKFQPSQRLALCLEDEPIFYLVDLSEVNEDDMVVDVVTLDGKGRFWMRNFLIDFYKIDTAAKEFCFCRKRRLYVSFQTKK